MSLSRILVVVAAALTAGAVAGAPSAARPDLVSRVRSGELAEARASWWGFDAEDATATLQAAIDSRVPNLVVDAMPSPWLTARTIVGSNSNQRIVFERGCEVLAKKGCFRGGNDCLFRFTCATNVVLSGYGATWRMRRMDYHAAPYRKAEWRHCLSLLSCVGVTVEGLVLAESGGDGIYVSDANCTHEPCRDIVLRDCVCDKNYRQGISVITVDGLLIENCVLKDTWGTPPAAGIDFEPNRPSERLRRCVMRNCVVENNQGCGIEFYLGPLTSESAPVDILVENCRTRANGRSGFSFANSSRRTEDFPTGLITVKGCTFEQEKGPGISIRSKPAGSVAVSFSDCRLLDNCTQDPTSPDVRVAYAHMRPTDDLFFENVTVRQSHLRPWLPMTRGGWLTEGVKNIRGSVEVVDVAGVRRTVVLDEAWRLAAFGRPPQGLSRTHVPFAPEGCKVVDPAPGELRPVSPVRTREDACYLFYVEKARRVNLSGRLWLFGRAAAPRTFTVRDMAHKVVATGAMPPPRVWTDFGFAVPTSGFYRLVFDLKKTHSMTIRAADVPLALEGGPGGQSFIGNTVPVWLQIPEKTSFAVQARGSDGTELVHITLRDPNGKDVWDCGDVDVWTGHVEREAHGGLWELRMARPTRARFEDFSVDLLAAPAVFFVSRDRYWTRPAVR